MKKFFALCMLAAGVLSGQNMIQDPDFDKGTLREVSFDYSPGNLKQSIFTEDLTWNKCLRVEVAKHAVDKKGRKFVYIACWLGKDGKNPGLAVKPNTVYEFQFECKGTIAPHVRVTEWTGTDKWKGQKTKPVTLLSKAVVSGEWNKVKGSFVTGPNTKFAALSLSLNGKEEWKNLIPTGSYFLVDKVVIQPKAALLPPASGTAKIQEKKITVPCTVSGKEEHGFVLLKTGKAPKADTFYRLDLKDGKVVADIRCMEPMMEKLAAKITGEEANVWADDSVEIFFSSQDPKRAYNQFAVSAAGGRWMGRGSSDGGVHEYAGWKADVKKEKEYWTLHCEFPLALLGWKGTPEDPETMRFLIARNRKPVKEISSSSFAKDGFHTIREWGYFFPNRPEKWAEALRKELLKKAAGKTAEEIRNWKVSADPAVNLSKVNFFREKILADGLAGRKFVVTLNPVTTDTEIPFLPAALADPPEKIEFRAAVSERCFVPLALTNLTERTEEYRVLVTAIDKHKAELFQLKTADGKIFPPDRMQLFRGIRMKDGDEPTHGLRYDALAPMDVTSTVVIPGRESAPVWLRMDTKGVEPGRYSGSIRVIPLGEAGTRANGKFSYRDLPFTFEVLPFALPEKVTESFLFQQAYSKADFRLMLDTGITAFLINPWGAFFDFAPDGSVTGRRTEKMEQVIRSYLAWAKEYGVEKKIRYCVCYSTCRHFTKVVTKNKFKPLTPAWEKAWTNYMLELDGIRRKYKIPMEQWSMELADEPKTADMPELIRAAELACAAVPGLKQMLTLAAWKIPPAELEKILPYIHEWCFWSTRYYTDPVYAPLIAKLREKKRMLTIYMCSTSMRMSLMRYFRCQPWAVPCFRLDGCSMYQHTTHEYRFRDWKEAARGEVVLMAGTEPVTTIRNECLAAGFTDLRYYAKLRELYGKMDPASPLAKEIAGFLADAPKRIVQNPPDNQVYFEETRNEMIRLILKAMGK